MSKSIPKSVWIGGFFVACAVYVWFFGPQTFFALQTRKIGREIPVVNNVPGELKDLSVAQSKGEKLSFQGAEFEVPWDDFDAGTTKTVGNCVSMSFRSSDSMTLCVGPPNMFMNNLFRNKEAEPELFVRTYGQEVLHSDYSLMRAIFETSPRNITLFTPAREAAGLASVIVIKALVPPLGDSEIYNVRSKNFQGFQLGNPSLHPAKMCLQLYADDVEFEFNLEQDKSGLSPAITQADLNRIIQTAHKAVHTQSILTVNPG
jgi:hypothetical protein